MPQLSLLTPCGCVCAQGRVFDRLHDQAEVHRRHIAERQAELAAQADAELSKGRPALSQVSKAIMKTRTASDFQNYGQRLYAEGIQSREKRDVLAEKARQERVDPELTFRPKIRCAPCRQLLLLPTHTARVSRAATRLRS
jgi:hypothetical protein